MLTIRMGPLSGLISNSGDVNVWGYTDFLQACQCNLPPRLKRDLPRHDSSSELASFYTSGPSNANTTPKLASRGKVA